MCREGANTSWTSDFFSTFANSRKNARTDLTLLLIKGGWFIVKILQGGAQGNLQQTLGQCFDKVRVIKPPASRSDSSEAYIAASGYRPGAVQPSETPDES